MTSTIDTPATEHGSEAFIPLNRLKKSPRNARKAPHSADAIEALAASIHAKGILQPPVVEPEYDEEGALTGDYLVTIGEGRRQAQLLRVKRKEIKKTELIRCLIDTANDAHEISLDENVTRSSMHPADQFEAFQRLAEERGYGAEEIAARFGVTATVVRQRLRLASVSPRLMHTYRNGELTLDQLMAFTVTEDHARQEGVWESLPAYERHPQTIRRHLTRDRVSARDRRAVFVGAEAYQAAGGVIERDLFAEDDGGYFADPALLDRLAHDKLEAIAESVVAGGWKWASLDLEHGLRRLRPTVRDRTPEEEAAHAALCAQQETFEGLGEWTDEDEARFQDLAAQIEALDAARLGFDPEDKAKSGAFVSLDQQGAARIEYGFVRPEDEVREPEPDSGSEQEAETPEHPPETPEPDKGRTPLSDTLVSDLTAHRTLALRDTLASQPEIAFTALLHHMVQQAFDFGYRERSTLDIRMGGAVLTGYAPHIADTKAGRSVAERHEAWATRLSNAKRDGVWETVAALDTSERLSLLAHCVSVTVDAVQARDGAWTGDSPVDALAKALSLDMTAHWQPTADSYFARVSKSRILEAVSEAASPDAARRLDGAKKAAMAEAAELLVAGTGWLPEPLRFGRPTVSPEAMAAE